MKSVRKSFLRSATLWAPAVSAALLLGAAWSMVGAQDESKGAKPAAGDANGSATDRTKPFGDKIVSLYTKGFSGGMGHNLEDVKLASKAGRLFLVGKGVDDGGWTRGLHVEVAWDEVASVIVYENIEQFNERIRESGQEHGGMGGNVLLPLLPDEN